MRYQGLEQAAKHASVILKAVANEKRLAILCCLAHQEYAVGHLSERVGLSQSALSQHLAKLRRDGLVNTRRDAQTIYYSLSDGVIVHLLERLHEVFAGDHGRSSITFSGSASNGQNCEPAPAK